MNGPEALAAGMIDAVATLDQDIDSAVAQFITPILKQAPQVVRAFKALAYGVRHKLPQFELEALEASHFATTWVHDDHWDAAEKILKPRREA
jgi:enoyl-CoA hydratase